MASSSGPSALSPAIKYEPLHSTEPSKDALSQAPILKRRRSEEFEDEDGDAGEKRQRIDSESQSPLVTEEFAAILAQTSAAVMQQHALPSYTQQPWNDRDERSGQPTTALSVSQKDHSKEDGHGNRFACDPHLSMRILSLPILESLSTQILGTLAQGPYSETINIVTLPESELGQAYSTLKSLFDQTKKIYSQKSPFLSADELNICDPKHRDTIRITNLATFVSSVFGGHEVGFYQLNDHFIETFTPDGKPLQKEPGELFLSLKTQMYLSAVSEEEQERTKEDLLEELFPLHLDEVILGRHPEEPLDETELEIVAMLKDRHTYLLNEPSDPDSIQALSEKFAWGDFLQSLNAHLSKAYEPLVAPYMKRHALTAPISHQAGSTQNGTIARANATSQGASIDDDIARQAELAAEAALQSLGLGNYQPRHSGGSPQGHQSQPQNSSSQNGYSPTSIPYPTQSAPTQVLYEKARRAAVSKANPGNSRRPGLPSQRRPWSSAEENALMNGLDLVRGPHWSQILALFGNGGTMGNVLKDRNQVQLKDKARNLKLFFLKSGIEVPYYLQSVTGELKTRAPSQAARREAEQLARLASNEERDRVNGIMTLANGLQDHSNGQHSSQSPPSSQGNSPHSQGSPEVFHVVEPTNHEQSRPSPSPQPNSDQQLLQTLMAANAAASSHGTSTADGQTV